MTRETVIFLKSGVAASAGVLALVYCLAETRRWRMLAKFLAVPLVLLAFAAVYAFFEFGVFRYGSFTNPHDIFHYYVGAKYSKEVGYFDLYRCALLADIENAGNRVTVPSINNLHTYERESAKTVLANAVLYKNRFPPERWTCFKNDIRVIKSITSERRWARYINDLGYNATPVWNMVGRHAAELVPLDSTWGISVIMSLDWALIVLMVLLVCYAFGWRAALFTVIFVGVNFLTHFAHVKGAFLRWDWLVSLVCAACMLRLGCYGAAGIFAAYAALVRVFPLVFLFGLGAKGLWILIREKCIDRRCLRFFVAFLIAVILLVSLSCADAGGTQVWKDFAERISFHNRHFTPSTLGFRNIFLMSYTGDVAEQGVGFREKTQGDFANRRVSWWAIQIVAMVFMGFAVRRLSDVEAFTFGVCPAFMLFGPQFYYQVMWLMGLLFFLPELRRLSQALGVAGVFAVSAVAYLLLLRWPLAFPYDVPLLFWVSWLLMVMVVYMCVVSLVRRRDEQRDASPGEPMGEETRG